MKNIVSQTKFRQQSLADESFRIFRHERCEEILMNDWVSDSSLPIPSIEFITFLAWQLLKTPSFLEKAGSMSYAEAVTEVVLKIRSQRKSDHLETVVAWWDWMESDRVGSTECEEFARVHEWYGILDLFHHFDRNSSIYHQYGVRGVTRRLLETLTLRAVLANDVDSIRCLAASMEKVKLDEPFQPDIAHRMASEVFRWQETVRSKLGQEINKSTIQAFLEALYPHFKGVHPTTWSAVWKIVPWTGPEGSTGKRRSKEAADFGKTLISQSMC